MSAPSVTLFLVDTEAHVLANNAIHHCVNGFTFDEVLIFTDKPQLWPTFRTLAVDPIRSVDDHAKLILEELPKHLQTDFVLFINYDAFPLNILAFSPEFFTFDFIGSISEQQQFVPHAGRGFSLRSAKLVRLAALFSSRREHGQTEDAFLLSFLRPKLEAESGLRFADEATNRRFCAVETASMVNALGFNGPSRLPAVYKSNLKFLAENIPDNLLRCWAEVFHSKIPDVDSGLLAEFGRLVENRRLGASGPGIASSAERHSDKLYKHLHEMGHGQNSEWRAFEKHPPKLLDRRVIAYYLPQFHPIPQNDQNWGKGFTEWRNVARALPLFEGHYQPRHPADLGFYDLRLPAVMEQQAALARNYGITGWAFYHYWFDGEKPLDTPIEQLHRRPEIEISYCVFWANENWTRSWDGMESSVLLRQKHSPQDDLAFIADVARYFADPRYLRHEGRPVLMMYRPQLLPEPRATAERWRQWCLREGIGDLWLIAVQAYGLDDPRTVGFDAAAEFPPHRGTACHQSLLKPYSIGTRYGRSRDIQCIDYASAVRAWSHRGAPQGGKLYKCVFPMWDNSARRLNSIPTVFAGASPALYREWLEFCLDHSDPGDFVFVNAWNEWAEGAYLEPDLHYGHAFLEATWQALAR